MNNQKKIAVFTSIRSEYGLLKPLLTKINQDSSFALDILVGGAHLLSEYGLTINEIKQDGFDIRYKFPFLFTDNGSDTATRSMAVLAMQINDYFRDERPDLLIVLGDRFELLPVVSAALVFNIPIAHISGGETTEGAIDNQVRHAVSKMAQLHFVATTHFKQNLMKMGEEEWRISISGELGLDDILRMEFIPKNVLYKDLGLDTDRSVVCATLHSETIGNVITPEFVEKLYRRIIKETNIQLLVTAANFDTGGQAINLMLESLSSQEKDIHYVRSLGKRRYFSLLKYCSLVLGNSSSGLVEVQSFDIPAINIGKRQQGRVANINVINVDADIDEILKAITYAQSPTFKAIYFNQPNIYCRENSAESMYSFIKSNIDKENLVLKKNIF